MSNIRGVQCEDQQQQQQHARKGPRGTARNSCDGDPLSLSTRRPSCVVIVLRRLLTSRPRQDFRTAVGSLRLAVRMDKSALNVRQRLAEVLLSQARAPPRPGDISREN